MDARTRGRLQAGLIAAVFAVPVVVALTMGLLGWSPTPHSYGHPIQPERNLVGVPVRLADGKLVALKNTDAVWTLVALPGPDCAERCLKTLDLAYRAQISLGRSADKLRLLYLGTPPAAAVAKGFTRAWTPVTTPSSAFDDLRAAGRDTVSAVLVTPAGKAMISYPAPFKPAGLRADLVKVVH